MNSVNGKRVLGQEFDVLVRRLQRIGRPVQFGLCPDIDVVVTVDGPPLELELRRLSGRVTVAGFCEVRKEEVCCVCKGRKSIICFRACCVVHSFCRAVGRTGYPVQRRDSIPTLPR